MPGTFIAAGLLLAASFGVGQAICRVAGQPGWPAYGGAVGLAALFALASLGTGLPGGATTAAVLVVAATAAAAVSVARDLRAGSRPPLAGMLAPALGLVAASLPFMASGRVGLLGVSLNNDTSVHMLWTEALRSERIAELYPLSQGYPTGPHALLASLAELSGIAVDELLTALLLSLLALTAAAALAGLRGLAPGLRLAGAVAVGVSYLAAAYFGQGAFKELAQALFVLAFALCARDIAARRPDGRAALRAGIPLALLTAGSVYVYSYLGLAWLLGSAGAWAALGLAGSLLATRSPGAALAAARRSARVALPVGAAAALGLVVATAPVIERTLNYFRQVGTSPSGGGGGIATSNLGNLPGPLSPYEALGLWPAYDFRFPPADAAVAALLAALAVGAMAYGAIWWLRRRDPWLPGAVAAGFLVYLASTETQSPYVAAKALAIIAPATLLLALRAVLDGGRPRTLPALARAVAAAAFVAGALVSSSYALRGTFVAPQGTEDELAQLRPRVDGATTLFLGFDDFAGWKLRGARLGYVPSGFPSPLPVELRPGKRWQYGHPLDVDSVEPAALDRFKYLIQPRTGYASAMPANFRQRQSTRSFELWERVAPTPRRKVIEVGAPGAPLRCGPAGPAVEAGRAAVLAEPVLAPKLPALAPGAAGSVELDLAPGRWDLSLQYTGPTALVVEAGGRSFPMPARLDRPGPFFHVGSVIAGAGPTRVKIEADRPSALLPGMQVAYLSTLAATRPGEPRLLSRAAACGRYVDWLEAS